MVHPQGRKKTKFTEDARLVNYFHPLIWCHIEKAARKAGKPWRPTEIVHIAKLANPDLFAKLSAQALGRWIDKEAKRQDIHKWTDKVLKSVEKGNAPSGHTTRQGILVSTMNSFYVIHLLNMF